MVVYALLFIWIVAGMVLGFAIGPAQDLKTTPIAFFHVPMAFAMEIGFMVAAWNGVRWLRTRNPRADAMSVAFAEAGTACGIIATATGSIFSKTNWNAYWSWDPQQVGIVATLLIYGALFALRSAVDDEEKRHTLWAVYVILGMIAAVFWTFIYRRLVPPDATLHPGATTLTSGPNFKMVLWFNIFAYTFLLVRIALLRARQQLAGRRLREQLWITTS